MRSLLLALAVLAGLALSLTRAQPAPPAAPTAAPVAPASPAATSLDFVPASVTLAPGSAAVVNLRLRDAVDLAAYEVQLAFDPAVIAVDRVDRLVGTGNPPSGRTWFALPASADPNVTFTTLAPGVIAFGAYSYGDAAAALDGDTLLARLTLRAVGTGSSALHLNTALVSNPDAQGSQPPTVDGAASTGGGLCVTGTVGLQMRTDYHGATVSAGALTTQTDADGQFELCGFAPGVHTVTASHPGFLAQTAPNVVLSAETAQVVLPAITLLGGDVYQQDQANRINILDLIAIASVYGNPAASRPAADINGNGLIAFEDLVVTAANYNLTGQTWGAVGQSKRETTPDERADPTSKRSAFVWLEQLTAVKAGEVFAVQTRVRGVAGLAGAELTLHFDPTRLEALGPADPGLVWPTDAVFVAANGVDNAAGEVRFAAATLGRRAASQGPLLTLRFRARLDGPPDVRLGQAQFVDGEGTLLRVNGAAK